MKKIIQLSFDKILTSFNCKLIFNFGIILLGFFCVDTMAISYFYEARVNDYGVLSSKFGNSSPNMASFRNLIQSEQKFLTTLKVSNVSNQTFGEFYFIHSMRKATFEDGDIDYSKLTFPSEAFIGNTYYQTFFKVLTQTESPVSLLGSIPGEYLRFFYTALNLETIAVNHFVDNLDGANLKIIAVLNYILEQSQSHEEIANTTERIRLAIADLSELKLRRDAVNQTATNLLKESYGKSDRNNAHCQSLGAFAHLANMNSGHGKVGGLLMSLIANRDAYPYISNFSTKNYTNCNGFSPAYQTMLGNLNSLANGGNVSSILPLRGVQTAGYDSSAYRNGHAHLINPNFHNSNYQLAPNNMYVVPKNVNPEVAKTLVSECNKTSTVNRLLKGLFEAEMTLKNGFKSDHFKKHGTFSWNELGNIEKCNYRVRVQYKKVMEELKYPEKTTIGKSRKIEFLNYTVQIGIYGTRTPMEELVFDEKFTSMEFFEKWLKSWLKK